MADVLERDRPADEAELELDVELEAESEDDAPESPADEIEPEPKPAKVEAEPEPEPEPAKVISVEDGIAEFKHKLAEAERAKAQAEQRAAQAEQQSIAQRSERDMGKYHQVSSALEAVTNKNKITQQSYAEAMRQGDYETVAKLQMTLAQEANALAQLESGKAQWEAYLRNPNRYQQQPAQQQPQRQAQPAQQAVHADPVEALAQAVAQSGSPRSADWIRKNPEYARDPALTQKMQKAHLHAVAEDLAPDTDAYFKHIEKRLGIGAKLTKEAARPVPAAPSSRSASPAAPSKEKVVLSHAQLKFCRDTETDPAVYAKNLLRARRQGRIS